MFLHRLAYIVDSQYPGNLVFTRSVEDQVSWCFTICQTKEFAKSLPFYVQRCNSN